MLSAWTIVIKIDLPFGPSCTGLGSLEVTWKYFMNEFYWHFKLQKSNKERNENNLCRLSKDWFQVMFNCSAPPRVRIFFEKVVNLSTVIRYNVADYMETLEFLSEVWAKFVQGKVGIDAVIAEYHKHGFDANQDIPGNVYWEELYPGWKIRTFILISLFQISLIFIPYCRGLAQNSRKQRSFWQFGTRRQHGGQVLQSLQDKKQADSQFLVII